MENAVKEKTTKAWKYIVHKSGVPSGWDTRKFDWSMNDSQIGRRLGVSRQMVWKVRRDCGAPLSSAKGVREGTFKDKILGIGLERLAGMTVGEIASVIGSSHGRAGHLLRAHGIKHAETIREPRIKFPDASNKRIWSLPNEVIANKYDTSPGYVALYRWRKGIPSCTKLAKNLPGIVRMRAIVSEGPSEMKR